MTKNPTTMADVIERLFTRLAATYGADWTRQWASVPIGDVKTAWSHELASFISDLPAIGSALDSLPERCPNVIQFKALCRACRTVKATLLLPEPKSDPAFVAQVLAKMADAPSRIDGKDWARLIIARHADGAVVSPYNLKCAREALGITTKMLEAA